jgi:hypothetical protein
MLYMVEGAIAPSRRGLNLVGNGLYVRVRSQMWLPCAAIDNHPLSCHHGKSERGDVGQTNRALTT